VRGAGADIKWEATGLTLLLRAAEKYEKEAAKSWDKFYKRNSTNFYKDRWAAPVEKSPPVSTTDRPT